MNVYHDIDKSDEIITIMFTIAMPWEAYDNITVCCDMIIKCKPSKNLLGKSETVVLFVTGSAKILYFTHLYKSSYKVLIVKPIFDFFISKCSYNDNL